MPMARSSGDRGKGVPEEPDPRTSSPQPRVHGKRRELTLGLISTRLTRKFSVRRKIFPSKACGPLSKNPEIPGLQQRYRLGLLLLLLFLEQVNGFGVALLRVFLSADCLIRGCQS